jgi:hypothetical protein
MRKRDDKSLAELAETVLPSIGAAIESVADKAVPILRDGRKIAKKKTRELRQAVATAAAPAPEPKKEKGSMFKKLVLLGALVALGGFVAKKVKGQQAEGNWQSAYVPSPQPSPVPRHAATISEPAAAAAPADAAPDDLAGATPDEALSDRAETPHADTTPDNPLEVVEIAPLADVPAGGSPYGEGSALPLEGGAAPSSAYTIKGNADSMLFHTVESPWFKRTVAEVWFTNEVAAEAAGFRHWKVKKTD